MTRLKPDQPYRWLRHNAGIERLDLCYRIILAMTTYGSIRDDELIRRGSVNSEKLTITSPLNKLYHAPLPPGFSRFPACKIILLIVLLHRLHIYSSFHFIIGLTSTRGEGRGNSVNEDSTVTAQLLMTSARFLAPLAGMFADKYLPRVKVLQLCLFISCIGSSIQSLFHSIYELNIVSISPAVYYCVHITAILFLTVGSSGAYALLVPVGVDQMEGANEVRLKSYFNWHYWFINVGALLAAGRFIYVDTQSDRVILLASSYLATLSIFLALILLMLSLHCSLLQRNQPPGGTPLKQVVGVVWCALSNRYSQRRESTYSTLRLSDYALLENRGRYSYEQVQDVKTFFKILFVLISMVWYFGVDNLEDTAFTLQGADLSQNSTTTFFSTRLIFFTDSAILLTLLPLIELIRNLCLTAHINLAKILYKFLIGVVISCIGLLIAFALNIYSYASHANKESISIYFIIPQTMILAVSECFAVVGAMEFVYAQSPHQMIGFLFGILQCMIGIGSYIPVILYYILQRASNCYKDENNCKTCLVHSPHCFGQESLNFVYYAIFVGITLAYMVGLLAMTKLYKRRERQKIEIWPEPPRH